MDNDFIPLCKPKLDQATIAEVVACLESGWLTTGPKVQAFEQALSEYCQADNAITVSSATAGLHLALLALNLQPGDEVITTPLTFAATLNMIALVGARPVLVDVDANTFNMDPNLIEAAITPHTRAIMPVHFAGMPVDMDAILDIANRHQLRVVEDAAHAIGTRYKDRVIGSFGDVQVFSFHPAKNITTAEGGCVTTADDEVAETIRLLRFHGMDNNAWNRYGKGGSPFYDIRYPGFKYNMTDLQAIIGLHQIKALDDFIHERQRLVNGYVDILKDCAELTLPGQAAYDYQHAWHIFTPLINKEAPVDREAFVTEMKANNIGIGVHYRSVHLSPFYREYFGYKEGDFPIAEDIANRIVSLPLYPGLTQAQQDRVLETIFKILRSHA